ncbi:hypothetical protein Tco_0878260 [Tanacetum coccineum]|uniref:Uncharacterized protein n=1 Tax=Tanacetum coccineum TaxID=301880 RepID=A0ABQ5C3A2_9ASTR
MSSPNRSTSDIEDAFSSMNILNYTSVSSDYFPASSGSSSFNSSENSTDNIIPPVFSSFYNNPCLKDVQAFYAKELPISSLDPITPPAILTPSLALPPSLLFDPRYFFVPEELLPPKKRIHSPSSSSTTLSNPSRNQTHHMRMILASVEKGPLVWPSITEDGVTRLKEYVELTPAEAIQADCDIKAINIILQGLPTEIYCFIESTSGGKGSWIRLNCLMQGTFH